MRPQPAIMAQLWSRGLSTYTQAEVIRDAFARHGVRYLFLGKSGAILLGYPDTTQVASLFLERNPENGAAAVAALREIGFPLTEAQADEIRRGKDFIQLRNGPFDIDLVLARMGSRASLRPGPATSRWRVFPSVASTTSSAAKKPRIGSKTARSCRD